MRFSIHISQYDWLAFGGEHFLTDLSVVFTYIIESETIVIEISFTNIAYTVLCRRNEKKNEKNI